MKPGDRFTDDFREYVVTKVTPEIVEYWDCYQGDVTTGRAVIKRLASRIQWDLDVASGALRLMAEPKGG